MPTPEFTESTSSANGGEGTRAKSKVAEIGERAADAIDDRRDSVARGIDSAASSLRERAERLPGGEKAARAAQGAAGAMETAADYLREHDMRDMLEDLQRVVKQRPGATLLVAAAVGFLLMRTLARR